MPAFRHARSAVLATAGGLGRAVLGLGCLVLIATLIPPVFGYQRFVVVGGSMEPTIHKGSIIYDEIVPVEDLKVGDVITYVMPGHTDPSSHRIVSREIGPDGSWLFQTKGDANEAADLRKFTLDRPVQAREKYTIPYAGWLFIWLGSQQLRMALLVAPAIVIAIWMLAGLWRESGRLLEEQRT